MKINLLVGFGLILIGSISSAFAADAAAPPQTGSFETSIATRSPLSEMKSLTKRLKLDGATADYDLSKIHFLVYVPPAYNPQKPVGLLVLANYKESAELPTEIFPQLHDANMALVVAKEHADEIWMRAGMALDAVQAMRDRYTIDRKRIYIMGGGEQPDSKKRPAVISERLALNFPEVFTGSITLYFSSYRPVKVENRIYPGELPKPADAAFTLAKSHPFILSDGGDGGLKEFSEHAVLAFKQDGFKYVKGVSISLGQYHYPHYSTDWLPEALKFMDTSTATLKLPATNPAAK